MIPYLLEKLNIPIIIDTDLGHDVENITFINGSYANLLVTDDKISFEMKV
jgi:muramoyltetrapeptide carboxypeptidase LdcA involved in peptidoglycan recycling